MGSPASYLTRICEITETPSQYLNRSRMSGEKVSLSNSPKANKEAWPLNRNNMHFILVPDLFTGLIHENSPRNISTPLFFPEKIN